MKNRKCHQKILFLGIYSKKFRSFLLTCLLLFPLTLRASFIEATIGAAVVNDATASYYNPAALTLLKNSQIVALGSVAYFRTQFSGIAIQSATDFMLSGTSNSKSRYFLPSAYLGIPINDKLTIGLAVISNSYNKDFEGSSILRYAQSNNSVEDFDIVPAIGFKLTDYFAIGAGISLSSLNLLLEPISGFPSLNIPDSQSQNVCSATSWGGDVGFLLKPSDVTLIGFNYRNAVTYQLSGQSTFEGNPSITSNHYNFKLWAPARSVFSINQFVTTNLGFISTIQYIQWSIFKNVNIHGIATQIGTRPVIVPNATVPFHLHNSWLVTLGSHYRIVPKWVIRVASSYVQSPSNANYQIGNGDSIILGGSVSYEISKNIIIDGSYAHAFVQNQNIHIIGRNIITGVSKGSRDSVSLKLTFNLQR